MDTVNDTVSRVVWIGGTRYTVSAETAGDLDELASFGAQLLIVAEHVAASLDNEESAGELPDALWATLRTARSMFGVHTHD